MPANANSSSAALVLGSGGARAAYEVGVARFLFEELRAELGQAPDLRIFCGTSAGALNASVLAAHADQPLAGVSLLARRWGEMRLEEMVQPDKCEVLRLVRALLGRPSRRAGVGSLLDPRPLAPPGSRDLSLRTDRGAHRGREPRGPGARDHRGGHRSQQGLCPPGEGRGATGQDDGRGAGRGSAARARVGLGGDPAYCFRRLTSTGRSIATVLSGRACRCRRRTTWEPTGWWW